MVKSSAVKERIAKQISEEESWAMKILLNIKVHQDLEHQNLTKEVADKLKKSVENAVKATVQFKEAVEYSLINYNISSKEVANLRKMQLALGFPNKKKVEKVFLKMQKLIDETQQERIQMIRDRFKKSLGIE